MRRLLPGVALAATLSTSAWADVAANPIYWNGSRSTPVSSGVTADDSWDGTGDNGFSIAWNITLDNATQLYKYVYTLSGANNTLLSAPGLSHWILQTTPQTFKFSGDPTYEGKDDNGNPIVNPSMNIVGPEAFSPGGSNPGMPNGGVHGVKFDDLSGDVRSATFTFYSLNQPVWGDFYGKGGSSTYAYNTGFGVDPGCVALGTCPGTLTSIAGLDLGTYEAWIVRPDSAGVVPEPHSYAVVLALGVSALMIARRRRSV